MKTANRWLHKLQRGASSAVFKLWDVAGLEYERPEDGILTPEILRKAEQAFDRKRDEEGIRDVLHHLHEYAISQGEELFDPVASEPIDLHEIDTIDTVNLRCSYRDRITGINHSLVRNRNITPLNQELLLETHVIALAIKSIAEKIDQPKQYELVDQLYTQVQFLQQQLWDFELSEAHHRNYELPQCTCPPLDNSDMAYHGRIIADDCPYHGFNRKASSVSENDDLDLSAIHFDFDDDMDPNQRQFIDALSNWEDEDKVVDHINAFLSYDMHALAQKSAQNLVDAAAEHSQVDQLYHLMLLAVSYYQAQNVFMYRETMEKVHQRITSKLGIGETQSMEDWLQYINGSLSMRLMAIEKALG